MNSFADWLRIEQPAKHVLAAQQYALVLQDEPSPLEQLQAHTAISLIHN